MSSTLKDKQKSLKRRFLLILGLITFICVVGFGLMLMLWSGFADRFSNGQRYTFGGVIILYAIVRFARLLKKDENE
ncbi:MAG: hypothetical protein ACXVAY_02505 [Mucilaginibacter sp.]